MKPCKHHIIGMCWRFDGDAHNYRLGSDREPRPGSYGGGKMPVAHYNFCPDCGTRITTAIIARQEAL